MLPSETDARDSGLQLKYFSNLLIFIAAALLQCSIGEGDCDKTWHCEVGSFCGYNNCDLSKPWHLASDDCCTPVMSEKHCSPPDSKCCEKKIKDWGVKVYRDNHIQLFFYNNNQAVELPTTARKELS